MRLPPSVVAMSLITAVPFGLAIRDTIRHPSANQDALDFDGSRARAREEAAAQERWDEAQRAAEAEHDAARARAIHRLYGAAPASLGSVFDGIHLGADSTDFQPESARKAIQALQEDSGIEINFVADTVRLESIAVDLGDSCDDLANQLRAAWGVSPAETWLGPDGQRARLDSDACTLTFDRAVDAAAWLDRSATAIVPLAELGKPASDLDSRPVDDSDDTGVTWHDRGVGLGVGGTQLSAEVTKGKITAITAEVEADPASIEAIEDRLTALLHGTPATDDQGVQSWKGPPAVSLEVDGTHLRLVAGAQP